MAATSESEERKVLNLCKMPFWHSTSARSSSSSSSSSSRRIHQQLVDQSNRHYSNTVAAISKSLLPVRRRLSLDPPNKLYFPYEPGKQVKSAIRLTNNGNSHVAFKFQTTAPKSCYMRPPGGIIGPGENLIATVFKFVEHLENNEKFAGQKSRVKFKIMSLKVKGDIDYIPELFDEQRDQVAVEKILRVAFLDPRCPCPAMDKLNRQLAEAEAAIEAAIEARKKPPEDSAPPIVAEGLVIDEWKERREKYLARQQIEGVDSL